MDSRMSRHRHSRRGRWDEQAVKGLGEPLAVCLSRRGCWEEQRVLGQLSLVDTGWCRRSRWDEQAVKVLGEPLAG